MLFLKIQPTQGKMSTFLKRYNPFLLVPTCRRSKVLLIQTHWGFSTESAASSLADCMTGFGPMWLEWWINADGWIIDTVSPLYPAGLWNTAPMAMMLASSLHFFMIEEISRNILWERQENSCDSAGAEHKLHKAYMQFSKASIFQYVPNRIKQGFYHSFKCKSTFL